MGLVPVICCRGLVVGTSPLVCQCRPKSPKYLACSRLSRFVRASERGEPENAFFFTRSSRRLTAQTEPNACNRLRCSIKQNRIFKSCGLAFYGYRRAQYISYFRLWVVTFCFKNPPCDQILKSKTKEPLKLLSLSDRLKRQLSSSIPSCVWKSVHFELEVRDDIKLRSLLSKNIHLSRD